VHDDTADDGDEDALAPTKEREQFQTPIDDTAPSNPALLKDPLIDTTVNGFRVEGVIGRGAAGIVYRAHQNSTGIKRAFKVLKPEFAEDPEYIRRLIEEAKALSALRHRGIIDIVDFGSLPNKQPYLVMELCDGLSLEDQLKFGGKPTTRETLGLMDELLSALIIAHGNGVVHRDLKPSNLFLATLPGGERALKVLDFGLARVAERKRSPTKPGTILGTPDYMAPEQIKGEADEQADVYAAGSIAFRLFTDQLPVIGKTGFMVIRMKMEQQTPHMRDIDPKVPPELDMLVHEMMAIDPVKRPTVRQAKSRFGAFLDNLNRGPMVQLQDDDSADSRPTTFHQFDDKAIARNFDRTVLGMPAPKFSPPDRPTQIEVAPLRPGAPTTDLEPALFEAQMKRTQRIRLAGIALIVAGLAAVLAWFVGR
jgi:serine/threonine-protein kinase